MRALRPHAFLLLISVMVLAPGVALLVVAFKSGPLGGRSAGTLSVPTNPAPTPQFDLQSFFSGATQSAMEPWLAERMGRPREIYLRLKNGFDFVLGRSDVGISIGRSRVLNGRSYVDDWCLRRDRQTTQTAVAPLVAAVAAIRK